MKSKYNQIIRSEWLKDIETIKNEKAQKIEELKERLEKQIEICENYKHNPWSTYNSSFYNNIINGVI